MPENCKRIVIGPPSGDLTDDTCRPVEATIGLVNGGPVIAVLVVLEDGEMERLSEMRRPAVWLSVYADHLVPFSIEVADGQGQ